VADIYKEKCHLLWEPPVDDGGIGIDYYLVEMQDSGVGRKWTEVGRIQGDTQCGIPNLEAGRKYKFRVRACNQEGESEPLATEKEILAKDPWGMIIHQNFSLCCRAPCCFYMYMFFNIQV